jgi:high-affinity iron transporter
MGVVIGIGICVIVGAIMIGLWYGLQQDAFSKTEDVWEGVFGLLASIIITIMGAALLRVSKMQEKWRGKIAKALESRHRANTNGRGRFKQWAEKYAMFLLPFITVLREGLEAVVFIAGVGIGMPASAFPLAVVSGLSAGCAIGFFIYRYIQSPLSSETIG